MVRTAHHRVYFNAVKPIGSPLFLLDPISNEDICLMGFASIAIGGEYELLAVSTEHWETVELGCGGYSFESGAIDVDHVKVEFTTLRIGEVGAEDDSLAVGVNKWRERRSTQVCHLLLVASIRIHDKDLQFSRSDQVLMQ